jgi:hypothetical protein
VGCRRATVAGGDGAFLRRDALADRQPNPSAGPLPEILAGIRVGLIRGVKGMVVGQLLVSIIGFGALFELWPKTVGSDGRSE